MSDNDTNTNTGKWRSKEVGALWARRGKSQNYFSGYVTIGELGFEKKVKIVGFKNNFKDSDKQPDFRLYESEDQVQGGQVQGDQVQGDQVQGGQPQGDEVKEEAQEVQAENSAPTNTEPVEGEDQELF